MSRVDATEWISELRRALTQLADADHSVELRADVISVGTSASRASRKWRRARRQRCRRCERGRLKVTRDFSSLVTDKSGTTRCDFKVRREFLLELESLPAASGAHSSPTTVLGFHGLTRLPHSAMKTSHQRRIREDDGALPGFVAMSLDNYGYQARSDHQGATDALRFRQPLHGGCGHVGVRRHAGSLADMSS